MKRYIWYPPLGLVAECYREASLVARYPLALLGIVGDDREFVGNYDDIVLVP